MEHLAAVFLIDAQGRILLQQRDDHVPPAGYGRWAVPGGASEGDESPRETALREFEEETSVRLERLRFFTTLRREEFPSLPREELHVFFADDAVPEDAIEVHEGLAFRYWAPDDALELPMNPMTAALVGRFLASDHYRGLIGMRRPYRVGVSVIALDRWGRALLQLRDDDLPPERYPGMWSLPGGLVEEGEAPDAAAFREFEEETGHLLETLSLFKVYRRDLDLPTALVDVQHVYYHDPDIDEDLISVNEGQAFRYFTPAETRELAMPPHTHTILGEFFTGTAYRALFH